jgi:hypothetical protein
MARRSFIHACGRMASRAIACASCGAGLAASYMGQGLAHAFEANGRRAHAKMSRPSVHWRLKTRQIKHIAWVLKISSSRTILLASFSGCAILMLLHGESLKPDRVHGHPTPEVATAKSHGAQRARSESKSRNRVVGPAHQSRRGIEDSKTATGQVHRRAQANASCIGGATTENPRARNTAIR